MGADRGAAGPVRLTAMAALTRFCRAGWQDHMPPTVDKDDADVERLCEAGLASIGHVPSIVKGGRGYDVLLLTPAGYSAASELDAGRAALEGGAGEGGGEHA